MEMALWILFCLFASIGLVQCGYWVTEAIKRPHDFSCGYHLIPLYDEPEQLEARLRFAFSQLRGDSGRIILVDMGLGDECQKICGSLTSGVAGIYICEPEEIADIVAKEPQMM